MSRHDAVKANYYDPFLDPRKMGQANNSASNRLKLHELMYQRVLTELVLHRFEWSDVPDSVDVRFLELGLMRRGSMVFFQHPVHDRFLVSEAAHTGYVNHYDNPTSFTVIANRMDRVKLQAGTECVPIWNNYLRTPDFDIIGVFAYKLASIDIDIEMSADNLRQTNIVAVPDGQRLSWMNLVRQRKMGEPTIFGHSELDVSAMTSLDIQGDPDALDKLLIAKTKVMNDCMTMLGIDNANVDKKERLVTEEVTANHEQVDSMLNIALKSRREAVDQINDVFELDIKVDPATGGESDGQMVGYDPTDLQGADPREGRGNGGDIHPDDS